MRQNLVLKDKHNTMVSAPVHRLIFTLAIPGIISMVITSIYNITDTYFVSNISTSASGAVGVSYSLMIIMQAIGFTIGHGSGNYISRLLGKKQNEYASKVAAIGFFTALGLGITLACLGLIFLEPLVYTLGATETIAPYAKDYIKYILLGAPYITATFVLNIILRFQGNAYFGMLGIGTGGILNIILDPIFIFKLKMGIKGAALATVVSQLISFCILYYHCRIGSNIKIEIKNFSFTQAIYKKIIYGGLPSFSRQALGSISIIFFNKVAGTFGDAIIASMSIVMKIFLFAISIIYGFGQGYQPVCGFNYGAKRYERVMDAFWLYFKTCIFMSIIFGIIGFLFSNEAILFFIKDDIEVVTVGSRALRFQSIVFPFTVWFVVVNITQQVIGKSTQAFILSSSRQGFFFIPVIFFLPYFLGITGIELC